MLNAKLETLNPKQTQMSLPTGRQAKHKTQNGVIFRVLDLFRILSLVFRV
jgi:hypothetical protein